MKWLKNYSETVYNPDCDDVLRVAFMHMYPRAKLADLVSLLLKLGSYDNELMVEYCGILRMM